MGRGVTKSCISGQPVLKLVTGFKANRVVNGAVTNICIDWVAGRYTHILHSLLYTPNMNLHQPFLFTTSLL